MSRTSASSLDIEDFHGHELAAAETGPETARAAALIICDRARDADDARHLLEVCGLAEYRRGQFTTYMFGRVRQP